MWSNPSHQHIWPNDITSGGPSNAKVECIALASVSFAFERSTNIAKRFITGGRISRGNSSITASPSRH
jgi:hypothetical protein